MNRIPERFPSTGAEAAISITRSVTHHRLGMHLRFATRLDAARLERAVRLSLDAEPVLGCAFRDDAFRPYWQRRGDLDRESQLKVVEAADAAAQALAFQSEEVPDEGPQVQALLLQTPDHDELSLKISHVVADGQATKQYAYLLASLYTALGKDPDFVPEPNLTSRPGGAEVWNALDAEQRRAAKKAKSWIGPTWTVPFARNGERPSWTLLALEPSEFAGIKAYGKRRGATVNDMLLAAVFRSCASMFEPAPGAAQAFMCTADLRRYLPDQTRLPIGNLSISGSMEIDRVPGETFDETLERVHGSTTAWAATCHGAAPFAASERLAALGYRVMRVLLGTTLKMSGRSRKTYQWFTNIGVIDDSRLLFDDTAPLDAYVIGPVAPGNVVPTVSTYRNRMRIALGHCESDCSKEEADRLLSRIGDELRSLAALPSLSA